MSREREPLVTHIYTADPSAHVYNGKIYIYPSHDIPHNGEDNDNGDEYQMQDYHVLTMDDDGKVYVYFGGLWGGQLEKYRTGVFDPEGTEPGPGEPAVLPRCAVMRGKMVSVLP